MVKERTTQLLLAVIALLLLVNTVRSFDAPAPVFAQGRAVSAAVASVPKDARAVVTDGSEITIVDPGGTQGEARIIKRFNFEH